MLWGRKYSKARGFWRGGLPTFSRVRAIFSRFRGVKAAYFFSDAHLGAEPRGAVPGREALLVRELRRLGRDASHVVILGDLFEFWYEYRHYVSGEHMALFRALGDLVDSGVQVHYLAGNHDFALEGFFPKALGVKVAKAVILETQGARLYCVHGDGLAKSDTGYRFARKVLDFPLCRSLFRLIHPDAGFALAKLVGRGSRQLGGTCEVRLDEYLDFGRRTMARHHCSYFLHGHHHIPGIWPVEGGVVASPGQWLETLNYLKLSGGKLELVKVEPESVGLA